MCCRMAFPTHRRSYNTRESAKDDATSLTSIERPTRTPILLTTVVTSRSWLAVLLITWSWMRRLVPTFPETPFLTRLLSTHGSLEPGSERLLQDRPLVSTWRSR